MEAYSFEFVVSLAIGLLLISLYFLHYYRQNSRTNSKLPPSFPALPFVGSLPFIREGGTRLYHYFMKKSAELGDIYVFYAGRRLALVLNGREAIVEALVNHAFEFADRSPLWSEENFLNTKLRGITFKHYNESFKKYHSIASSALNQMTFGNALTESRIKSGLEMVIGEIILKREEEFDPKILFNEFSGTTILSVLLGERFLQHDSSRARDIIESSNTYLANIDPMLDVMPLLRYLPMFRRKLEAMSDSSEILLRILEEEVKVSLAENADESFAKRFAENGCCASELDNEELVYIVRDLVFGATQTVATTLLWAVVLLANHRDVQSRMREEILSVIPDDRHPTMRDKSLLPFSEAVMLEVLRRKCVAPFSSTRATIRDTEIKGFLIPAGTMVLVNLYSAHMDSRDWEEPETFRPERFLDGRKIVKREFVMPFCLGIRSCIGETIALQEIFLLLCSLVQMFDIQPPKGTEKISEEEIYRLVLSPPPFRLRFIPRCDDSC